MPRRHIAIIDDRFACLLLSGEKRIESRFSRTRRTPFDCVYRGDEIYFKISGGDIIGRSAALSVVQYDRLTPAKIEAIRRRHNHAIQAPPQYWDSRRDCQYAVLIRLGAVSKTVGEDVIPRQYGSGWIIL